MSHVAEGELHAWLDGALDQLGEKRAEQVREHLRRCAACQESLAAEEAVRARATEVLGLVTPLASEMPPLETLMARAKAAPTPVVVKKPSRMSRAARLGWAASVVIALGAGWTARELGLHTPGEPEGLGVRVVPPSAPAPAAEADAVAASGEETGGEMAAASAAAPTEEGSVEGSRRTRVANVPVGADPGAGAALDRVLNDVAASTAKVEELASSRVVATAPPPVFVPAAPARESGAIGAAAAAETAQREASSASPPPSAPARVAPSEQNAAGGVAGGRTANAQVRPAPGRQERAASSAVPATAAGAIGIQRARPETAGSDVPNLFVDGRARGAGSDRQSVTAPVVTSEADESEARDLIVSGLDVLRVEWTEVVPGQTGLRVLQRLESGDTLEIRFVRSGGAAADAVSPPLATILGTEPVDGGAR